jgi:hypothetical protein
MEGKPVLSKSDTPGVTPRIISDNGPQFIAKDFKEFIRISGLTHVRTSPYRGQSFRESDVFVDGGCARAIEARRAEFFLHLDDSETGIRMVNESLETKMLERCYSAAVVTGSILRERSRRQPRQPVAFCFLDHDPAVWILGCAGALLLSLVVGDWGDGVNEFIPVAGQEFLKQVPSVPASTNS